MGRQSKRSRIYWRDRGGTNRAYADLRDYADAGGGREALVAPGEKLATADRFGKDRVNGAALDFFVHQANAHKNRNKDAEEKHRA